MTIRNLLIGGIEVARIGALELRQSYEWIGGVARRRMQDGALVEQWNWRKLRIVTQGAGWMPAALSGLVGEVSMACAAPMAASGPGQAVALPTPARVDAPARGYGLVGGKLVATPVAVAGQVGTCTAVPGAASYEVHYYPLVTVIVEQPRLGADLAGADFDWELVAEEA